MFPHRIEASGNIPGVQAGVLLAWPCPICNKWAKPKLHKGRYGCRFCPHTVTARELNEQYQHTRLFSFPKLTRN